MNHLASRVRKYCFLYHSCNETKRIRTLNSSSKGRLPVQTSDCFHANWFIFRNHLLITLLFFALIGVLQPVSLTTADVIAPPVEANTQLSPSDLLVSEWNLTCDLLNHDSIRTGEANRLIAPHSLAIVMRLLYAGAAGSTAQQIEKIFPKVLESGLISDASDTLAYVSKPVASSKHSLGAVIAANNGYGVIVRQIMPKQAAETAGLRVGDMIIAINDAPIRSPDDLEMLLDRIKSPKGEMLRIRIYDFEQGDIRNVLLLTDNTKDEQEAPAALLERRLVLTQSDMPLTPEFLSAAYDKFKARVFTFNFRKPEASDFNLQIEQMAAWTRQPIQSMRWVSEFTPDTRMILASVLEFKSTWVEQFPPAVPGTFQNAAAKKRPAMFFGDTRRVLSASTTRFDLVEIPYKEGQASFVLILPKIPGEVGVLSPDDIKQIAVGLDEVQSERIQLKLPRFAFNSIITFDETLKSLGMTVPYSQQADFSRITTREPLRLSSVKQNSHIDFNPNGTVAGTLTKVEIQSRAADPVRQIIADHPFLFLIINRSAGKILFAGHIHAPT